MHALAVDWDPSGNSLTFLDSASPTTLFSQRTQGGTPGPILQFQDGEIVAYRWSPDGKRILLIHRVDRTSNLWVASGDGTDLVQVTGFATGTIFAAKWTRDGREIVYTYGTDMTDAVLISHFR